MEKKDNLKYVKTRAKNTKRRNSNCMGTSFYLVGEQDEDVAMNRKSSLEMLSKLQDSENPEEGYIVYWKNDDYLLHSGIIFDKNSLMMIHRRERNGILEKESIEEVSKYFGEAKYKIPSRFS